MKLLAALVSLVLLVGAGTSCSSGSSAAGADCESVAIAFVGPLTGPTSALGRPLRNAVQMALGQQDPDECPVGLVEFDTQGNPDQAGRIARQLVDQSDIVGVVGPTQSGETSVAMPIFEAAGLAVLTPSATNAELGTKGWRSFHRMVTSDSTQGPAIARYLASALGFTRIAIIDDGDLYGDGIADLVASSLPAFGAQVVARRSIDPASRDYTGAISEVTAAQPQALFFGGTDVIGARLVRQLREAGKTTLFSAPDAVFTSEFLIAAGAASQGAVVTCPCAPTANGQRASLRLFASRYLDAFGAAPGPFGAEAYDAAIMLVKAIHEAGPSRAGVLDAIDGMAIEGATGAVSFDDDGEVTEGPVYIYVVQDDRYVPTAEVVGDQVEPAGGR